VKLKALIAAAALGVLPGIVLAQAPEEARAQDARGVASAEAGNLAGALEEFREALRIAPDFPEAHYHAGLAHARMGHTDEAMGEFEQALRLRPELLQARYQLASSCRNRGDFEGEQRLLADVAQQAPDFAEARYNYGLSLQHSEKPAEALVQLRAAARLDPKSLRYSLALGIALADRDHAEAIQVLRRAVELAPGDPEIHYNLALAMATGGDESGAIREFQAVLHLNPIHVSAHRGLGVALMHEDRLNESADELKRAASLSPRDAEAANNLGMVLLRLKDISGAIEALERAVNINPKLIKAHSNLAQAYQRAGRKEDSRAATDRAAALTAEQRSLGRAMVLVQSARQRRGQADASETIRLLREAIAAQPAFAEAHLELGRTLLESGRDPDGAIREFREVLNLDPEISEAHYQIGQALLTKGDRAAFDEFRAAGSMSPCRVEIMRALGEFRRLLAWDPHDEEARAALEKARLH
jgi:tetratricopeptide (TPR) repeat protein